MATSTTGDSPFPGESNWKLAPEFAHPRARMLFREPFFWDGIDDHSPWGSDEGSDALAVLARTNQPSREFVLNYAGSKWSPHAPHEGMSELDIEEFSFGQMEVIAMVLGMYFLHGYIPNPLKTLGIEAIDRELLPCCLRLFGEPEERARKLQICRQRLLEAESEPPQTQSPCQSD